MLTEYEDAAHIPARWLHLKFMEGGILDTSSPDIVTEISKFGESMKRLLEARTRLENAKALHGCREKDYAAIKEETEFLKCQVRTLRMSDASVKDQIDRAVQNVVKEATAAIEAEHVVEIAGLKLKNVRLSTMKLNSEELAFQKEISRILVADLLEKEKEVAELRAKMAEMTGAKVMFG